MARSRIGRQRLKALLAGTVAAVASSYAAAVPPRVVSFDERVSAERAVQEVYWQARAWPEGNLGAKPPLAAVMSDDAVRARVLDLLRKSNALATRFGRVPSAAMLSAELQRMASATKAPETLRALFTALGNDPVLEAETLARRALVERDLRSSYAWDRVLHAALRGRAEAVMARVHAPADLAAFGASYRERVVRLDGSDDPDEIDALARELRAAFGTDPAVPTTTAIAELPVGRVSALIEDADTFSAVAVLGSDGRSLRIATATWRKTPFESWWRAAAPGFAPLAAPLDGPVDPAIVAADRACATAPPWVPTPTWGVPSPRYLHTAVWTGAEMLVWGGQADSQWLGTGHRYDPATDTWSSISTIGAPAERSAHTAVWTGSKMIVWGGSAAAPMANGALYDPATDHWQPTATAGAPSARVYHSAVWTGSRMIVWGGLGGGGTGASYDPVANSWAPISSTNAPGDRSRHVAAWTGARMVIWGGRLAAGGATDTGGVYDPVTDSWIATASPNAPSPRWGHVGVWSGSALWVWGGTSDGTVVVGDGARYTPVGNAWTPMSGTGAPLPRTDHRAVWTGTQLVVWGGTSGGSPLGDGARYVAASESWTPLTDAGAPAARRLHTAVWSGSRMLVFGGLDARSARADGGRYEPLSGGWETMSAGVWAPSPRRNAVTASTGAEFLVYGGETLDASSGPRWSATGAVYDPAIDDWRPMTPPDPAQVAPRESAGVWTGSELIIWGGREASAAEAAVDRGGRYNPATDAWASVATDGAPAARSLHSAVWTGSAMIVWGGSGTAVLDSGGRYDPAVDSWAGIASGGTARYAHTAVWTGTRMIAWGGLGVSGGIGGPAVIYDPVSNLWSSSQDPLPGNDPPPSARINHTAVWTGSRMIVWGGQKPTASTIKYNDGAGYDPALDRWFATPSTGAPSVRDKHTAVWTGSRMIVWGGTNSCCFLDDGGEYDAAADTWAPTFPTGAPAARGQHAAATLGSATIVWGGLGLGSRTLNSGATYCACSLYRDQDGDGYGDPASLLRDCAVVTPPAGYVRDDRDCNDASAAVNPLATDATCDGIDQNCSGAADEGYVPVATSCGVGACAATGTSACVGGAETSSCTPGLPSPELCDGIDNDCNGLTDDVPSGLATLTLAKSGSSAELTWTALFSASSYDLTRGGLGTLRATGGDFAASVDACIADDTAATTAPDDTVPPVADAYWYLVRGNNCAGTASYDEAVPSQSGSRDAGIAASPAACP